MQRQLAFIWIVILVTGCYGKVEPGDPKRPISVPQEAIWSGGPKGGDWGKCESVNSMQVSCEFFSRYGTVKKSTRYELCVVRRFRPSDFKSPIGASPAFLENEGMGWIDSAMIQFVPFGDVEVHNWKMDEAKWVEDTERTEYWTKTARETALELCKEKIVLSE